MHLQSTYESPLLLKFNSTTLQTWWCTWEVMYTFFPSPCCSDPHRTVLQQELYLQRTLRMCKMITRSLRRIASRYSFRNSSPNQQWKKNDISSSLIPPASSVCHYAKLEEKGDSYHMICGTEVTYHPTCCCIAKLYSWYSALTTKMGQVPAESHISVSKLEGITPKGHQVTHTFQQLHAYFHRAH